MTVRLIAALIIIAPLLGGCLTAQSRADLDRRNEEICAKRGHPADSKAFLDCLASLEAPRERRMNERRQEMLERSNMPAAATR
jgi:hypothetical protein